MKIGSSAVPPACFELNNELKECSFFMSALFLSGIFKSCFFDVSDFLAPSHSLFLLLLANKCAKKYIEFELPLSPV